ncbi:MAG TPA: hypothetical protein PK384_13435 [Candidatus Latescibacteria bacterium]|nr:hypothetical protein [Candidatus Latescibacterota bacterium]
MELSNKLLQPYLATARITGIGGPSGKPQVGTGFFLDFACDAGKTSRWLVTNKHLVEGCTEVVLRLHAGEQTNDGKFNMTREWFELVSKAPAGMTVNHPTDDLCAMSGEDIVKGAGCIGKLLAAESLTEGMIPAQATLEEMSVSEDVIIVGYPAGRMDEKHGLPVLRRGCTASHPGLSFGGGCRGLLDAHIYFGSSGSPVLVWDDRLYLDAGQARERSRRVLLGVVVDHDSDEVEGEVLVNGARTTPSAVARVKVPLHLGSYIRAEALLVLKEAIRAGGRLV